MGVYIQLKEKGFSPSYKLLTDIATIGLAHNIFKPLELEVWESKPSVILGGKRDSTYILEKDLEHIVLNKRLLSIRNNIVRRFREKGRRPVIILYGSFLFGEEEHGIMITTWPKPYSGVHGDVSIELCTGTSFVELLYDKKGLSNLITLIKGILGKMISHHRYTITKIDIGDDPIIRKIVFLSEILYRRNYATIVSDSLKSLSYIQDLYSDSRLREDFYMILEMLNLDLDTTKELLKLLRPYTRRFISETTVATTLFKSAIHKASQLSVAVEAGSVLAYSLKEGALGSFLLRFSMKLKEVVEEALIPEEELRERLKKAGRKEFVVEELPYIPRQKRISEWFPH